MQTPAKRNQITVIGLLIALFTITYLDRICISVAGPRMQQDLHISPSGWGWVTGMFTLAYGIFEIPTGALADRLGPRRILTRIVLWWSAFTALTGAALGYYPLLLTRFLFGAGEAGAFPGASVVVSRWFPPTQRATLSGVNLSASQIGGALAPLLVVPIQQRHGWRMTFFIFGLLGVVWSAVWYAWFRDSPAEKEGLPEPSAPAAPSHTHHFPWRLAFRSPVVLGVLATAFCYVYVYNFFQTWLHTFLVKGRNFSEGSLLLSSLPFLVAACANLAGGRVSDILVRKWGLTKGRRALGVVALAFAGVFTLAAMFTREPVLTVILLSLVYGGITFQQPGVFGVCMDIGGKHAGAMVGMMNTAAQAGGFIGSVAFGYIVERTGSYDAPFIPMAAILFTGALLWLKIDASARIAA